MMIEAENGVYLGDPSCVKVTETGLVLLRGGNAGNGYDGMWPATPALLAQLRLQSAVPLVLVDDDDTIVSIVLSAITSVDKDPLRYFVVIGGGTDGYTIPVNTPSAATLEWLFFGGPVPPAPLDDKEIGGK